MDWVNLFLNALNAYLAVWIAKSILVLADVHVAAGVTHRITGRPIWVLMGGLFVGIVLTTLFAWPRLLVVERWRFFLTYSRFSVIRQVVEAYRDAQVASTKEVE
jgi:hypothetical protein